MPSRVSTPGVHFTPQALARRVAESSLGKAAPPGPVLDPACGDGALLVAAWRVGAPLGLAAEELHGIELDDACVRRARERLRAEIGGAAGERAARNVRRADALAANVAWPRRTSIVANPPWVSFSGRHSARAGGLDGCVSRGDGGRGWPSLHGAFLERIAEHVAHEGTRACVLVPSAVCELERYGPLRARVTSLATLMGAPAALGEDAFPGVVEPAALLALAGGAGECSAAPWRLAGGRDEEELVARLHDFPRLPAAAFGDIGVHTGNAAAQLLSDEPRDELPGIREGRDLAAYRLGAPRRRLDVQLVRSAERRFRYGPLERYREVAVLVRQTASRPIAALHTAPTYFRNSLLACRPPAELDPAFVVGVLNSPVLAAWHRASFLDANQRAFPQVKVSHLRRAPFPIAVRAEDRGLHDRVARVVREMAAASATDREVERGRLRVERWVAEGFGIEG